MGMQEETGKERLGGNVTTGCLGEHGQPGAEVRLQGVAALGPEHPGKDLKGRREGRGVKRVSDPSRVSTTIEETHGIKEPSSSFPERSKGCGSSSRLGKEWARAS